MTNAKQNLHNYKLFSNIEDFSSQDLVEMLKTADDHYFNSTPLLTDEEYDILKSFTQQENPYHEYFQTIGVQVRTGKTKLPFQMGSLNQAYVGGDLFKWVNKHSIQDESFIATEKLDGVSAMVLYDDTGNFRVSYSRGDGIEGAIIDRHLTKVPNLPTKTNLTNKAVRGEVIISKSDFLILQNSIKSRSGEKYKNARNCVAGLMNAEKNDPQVYQYLRFIAYEIIGSEKSKIGQLEELVSNSFNVPKYDILLGSKLNDDVMKEYVETAISKSSYDLDGVVIDVNSAELRKKINPTKETLNPEYTVKYKITGSDNQRNVVVTSVEWSISKHGYLKPVVHIEPTNLCGVTITKATGFNAAFIWNNKIGPGAIVSITRSGDVIPFINQVVTPSTPQMPQAEWDWNETHVDAVLLDLENHNDVKINRMVDFFSTLSVSHMKEGNVTTLFNSGYDTPDKIINMSEQSLREILGENGTKIFESLTSKLSNIPLYELMGAHSTARGIGVRKLKKIQNEFGDKLLKITSINDIISLEGFDIKTANQILFCIDSFNPFLEKIRDKVHIVYETQSSEGQFKNKSIVFTGFRNGDLEKMIEMQGGSISSGVSKKTSLVVAKDPNDNSSKIQKAAQLNIPVLSLDAFLTQYELN